MIETPRLYLRGFQEEDWQAVQTYSTDPEVVRYVPAECPSEEETRDIIRSWMNGQTDTPPHHDFAITVRPDDFVIGWCCLQISASDPRVSELMYVLNRNFWNHGYATEAAQAVVDYGFSKLQFHRIYAKQFSPTQRALDWRVRAAFSGSFLARASSVKMALSPPSRQQVTHTVRRCRAKQCQQIRRSKSFQESE